MIQPLLIPTAAEKRIDTDFYVEGYATTFDKPYLLYEWDGNKYYETDRPERPCGCGYVRRNHAV